MKKILLIALYTTCMYSSYCQSPNKNLPYPEVGKPCPDFVLNDVHNYPKTQIRLNDFKGKWLILDFWSKGLFWLY